MAILPQRSLIVLLCHAPERQLAFYLACGFTFKSQIPHYTELTLGSFTLALTDVPFMQHFLGTALAEGQPRFVLSLHSDAVDADLARLLLLGAEVVLPATDQPWGQRVAYLRDPEGNLLEIAQALKAA